MKPLRLLTACVLLLPGCALVQRQVAADSEELLAEAGFQRHPLHAPSRQLVEVTGSYEFADPDFCHCIYVGGAAEYSELLKLRAARIAEREWIIRRTPLPADRTLWSSWKPEGLDPISAELGAGYVFIAPIDFVR